MNSNRMRGLTGAAVNASLHSSAGFARRGLKSLFLGLGKSSVSQKESFENSFAIPVHVLAPTVDHGLAAVGVAAAIGSAVFAGYMMTHDNSRPAFGGAEHLKLFAQPLNSGWRGTPIGAGRAGGRQVDYNATGSIRHGGLAAATVVESKGETAIASADGKIQVPRHDMVPRRDMVLDGYVVRFVHKGLAIVQGRQGSFAVAPGVTLPDAGRVLSVEKRGNRWVVVTAKGMITEAVF